jgi:ribosomal protein S18 acetylase RimI-like enzyme
MRVLGTSPRDIDRAENRNAFSSLLEDLGVPQPAWKELTSLDDTRGFVFPQANETVHLLYLAVDEAFRGQGIAHALVASCEGVAREWGRSGLLLDITDDNPAMRLYERFGFEEIGLTHLPAQEALTGLTRSRGLLCSD